MSYWKDKKFSKFQTIKMSKNKMIIIWQKYLFIFSFVKVEILKNQVSAFASDLSKENNKISILNQESLAKKQRLNGAK